MPSKPLPPLALTVVPASAAHWSAIEVLFAQTPCWCQSWRVSASEYGRVSKETLLNRVLAQRRAALRRQLEKPAPPGILAYAGDEPIGWCGLGPRHDLVRLVRSRTIPAVDDLPVWSIVCFLVRTGYRRRGVAAALLQGAIDCARAHGAPALEAYPVDPAGQRISANFAYVGTTSVFEKAGFRRLQQTEARSAGLRRWIMRLKL
jgi:GNAT superfamily N-acetyltransferase